MSKVRTGGRRPSNALVTGRMDVSELEPALDVGVEGVEVLVEVFYGLISLPEAPQDRDAALPDCLSTGQYRLLWNTAHSPH